MGRSEIASTLLQWNNTFLPHGFIASLADFKEKEITIRAGKVSRAYRYLIKKAIGKADNDKTCCYRYIKRVFKWIGYYQDYENELKIITTKGYSVLFKIQQDDSIRIIYYSDK